jgi:hypothetical protein
MLDLRGARRTCRPLLVQGKDQQLADTPASLPEVGQLLPDFSLTGTDGATHTVADLVRDHRGLVLFYFPKANTDG